NSTVAATPASSEPAATAAEARQRPKAASSKRAPEDRENDIWDLLAARRQTSGAPGSAHSVPQGRTPHKGAAAIPAAVPSALHRRQPTRGPVAVDVLVHRPG